MSGARTTFWRRIGAIRAAITDYSLQDLPMLPGNESRNGSVRVIRNGLAVQCFNVLEDFLKGRTSEVLADLSNCGVRFEWLPDALKEAVTLGAVKAIAVQVKRRARPDRVQYAQTYGARVASTQTGALQLADIGFFHIGSNVGADDVAGALSAFNVHRPWEQLSGILSRVNLSALPAENVFTSLAVRRHAAAHEANTTVSEGDLVQSTIDAAGVALGFDLLLTRGALTLSKLAGPAAAVGIAPTTHSSIALRFIRQKGILFQEIGETNTRSIARAGDWQGLMPAARTRASARSEALVVFREPAPAISWYYGN